MRPRRVFAYGALGITFFLVTSLAFLGGSTGCYGEDCKDTLSDFGNEEGQGRFIPPDIWESQRLDDPNWLLFSGKRTYRLHLHGLEGRRIFEMKTNIAVMPDPNASDQVGQDRRRYAPTGGNLSEYHVVEHGKPGVAPIVTVRNDTCGEYYAHVRIIAEPAPPPLDAGAPTKQEQTE